MSIRKLALVLPVACTIGFSAPAQPLPSGSYQGSCSSIAVNGAALRATCKTMNQKDNDSTLSNYASCTGDIANADGVLTCKPAAKALSLPAGSYQSSCSNLSVYGIVLQATCKTAGGHENDTALPDYASCTGDIANADGVLICKAVGAARLSVGTSTDLRNATEALIAGFSSVAGSRASEGAGGQAISVADLRRVAEHRGSTYPKRLEDAARFYLSSPAVRSFVSSGAGKAKSDGMTRPNLENLQAILSAGQFEQALLGGITGNDGYAAVLRDAGIPNDVREGVLRRLSDSQLLNIIGRPNLQGDARDKADEMAAFLGLAKMSWLGAAEAEALARYHVPFSMIRGAEAKDVSYWDGKSMHVSEKMVKDGKPGYISEVLAHEGGHALYQMTGLDKRTARDIAAARLANHIDGAINEGFAGAFGNRARITLFGLDDPVNNRHLVLLNDVSDQIDRKAYGVDPVAARAHIDGVKRVLSKDLVSFLQENFNLLGDPVLSLGLESPPLR